MSERKVILNHSAEFDTIDKIKEYFLNTNIVGDALVSLNEETEGIYAYKGMGEIISLGVQGARGAQGNDGTGVNVKPSKDDCKEAGDAYIDKNGNILIFDGKDAFVNAGQVMGPQGNQGVQGSQGVAGVKGEDGVQGSQGVNGIQGSQGVIGLQGSQGAQGVQGAQGDLGVQGNQGVIGSQGSQGVQGTQGEKGIPGEMGYQGEKGDKGVGINIKPSEADCKEDGDAYIKQDTGEILILYITWAGNVIKKDWVPAGKILGPQGVQGIQGHQGLRGEIGVQGNQGVIGLQGVQGSQGIMGVQGENGIQGSQGSKGDKGNDGTGIYIKTSEAECKNVGDAYIDEEGNIQIFDGEKFNNGGKIRGPQGAQGVQGSQGSQGLRGEMGVQGNQGVIGLQGAQGSQGAQGESGKDGTDGITPNIGVRFDEDVNMSYFTVSYDGKTTQDICPATYRITLKDPEVETLEAGSSAGVQGILDINNSAMTQSFTFKFRIPKGDPGTGINIKANQDACNIAGDAYIDEDGHIQILESIVDSNKVFNDGGQIKGPQGVQGSIGDAGTPGTTIAGAQANIRFTGHGETPYVAIFPYDVKDNELSYNFDFYNIVGRDGDAGGVYIPSVDESGNLGWAYSTTSGDVPTSVNIKGKQGTVIDGVTAGIQGAHSDTPTCEVTTAGTEDNMSMHFEFIGIQGVQGARGVPGADGKAATITISANTSKATSTGTPKVTFTEGTGSSESNRTYVLTLENLKGQTGSAPFTGTSAQIGTNNPDSAPSVSTKISNNKLVFTFNDIKGNTGEPGQDGVIPFDTVSAAISNEQPIGDPSVTCNIVENAETKENVLSFDFANIQGVTYTPSLSEDKTTLTWSNDGNKNNPEDVRVKGSVISAITVNVDSSTADEVAGKKPICVVTSGNTEWEPTFNLSFSGICGKASTVTLDSDINEDTGATRVVVVSGGSETARHYDLHFYNLKGDNGSSATVEISSDVTSAANTGSPEVSFVQTEDSTELNKKYSLTLKNLKGEKGDSGSSATVEILPDVTSATNTGSPEVSFVQTGDSTEMNKKYSLTLKNLKGAKGEKGDSVAITALGTGTQGHLLVVNKTQGYLSALTVNSIENIYAQDGSVYAENGFYEYSDETLKYFMGDIPVDFDNLKSLPKKYFMWRNREKPTEIGTSAQKVQQIYPELVTTSPDGHLTVNYGKLSIVALRAIDLLYDRINVLESEIEQLKK